MTAEELEGCPYGPPPDGIHDLMIESYLERQTRYAREDFIGTSLMRSKEEIQQAATSEDFRFLGRALAAVVKGVCLFLKVPVSKIRTDVVESFNRSLEWGERSDALHGREEV